MDLSIQLVASDVLTEWENIVRLFDASKIGGAVVLVDRIGS